MAKAVDKMIAQGAEDAKLAIEYVKPVAETMVSAADPTVVSLNKNVELAVARSEETQGRIKQKMDKVMKSAEDMVSFNQGNIEAMIASSQIWAAGMQDLTKQMAATAQAQFETSVSAFRAMTSVKSIKDAVDLQSSLTRTSFEKAVAETGRITDASLKLAEQTYAPLGARLTLAVEKFGKTA